MRSTYPLDALKLVCDHRKTFKHMKLHVFKNIPACDTSFPLTFYNPNYKPFKPSTQIWQGTDFRFLPETPKPSLVIQAQDLGDALSAVWGPKTKIYILLHQSCGQWVVPKPLFPVKSLSQFPLNHCWVWKASDSWLGQGHLLSGKQTGQVMINYGADQRAVLTGHQPLANSIQILQLFSVWNLKRTIHLHLANSKDSPGNMQSMFKHVILNYGIRTPEAELSTRQIL